MRAVMSWLRKEMKPEVKENDGKKEKKYNTMG